MLEKEEKKSKKKGKKMSENTTTPTTHTILQEQRNLRVITIKKKKDKGLLFHSTVPLRMVYP